MGKRGCRPRLGQGKGGGALSRITRAAQDNGRNEYYASYTLFGCDNPRIHHFEARDTTK